MLNNLGIRLPAESLLRSPLDLKVGRHYLDRAAGRGRRVLAICDFASMPLSYDVVYFLTVADNFRRRQGASRLDVAFLAHHDDPHIDGVEPSDPAVQGEHRTFVHNLGVQATQLYESIGDVHFFTDRPAFTDYFRQARRSRIVFPTAYVPECPDFLVDGVPLYGMRHLFTDDAPVEDVCSLRPPLRQLDLARRWLERNVGPGKTVISLTLRESPMQAERNSKIEEWQKLIDHYRGTNVVFVVVRDFFTVYQKPALTGDNVVECPEAVLNILFRSALYEAVDLNLFVLNGPCCLCFFNPRTRYLVFGVPSDPESDRTRRLAFRDGLEPGDHVKGAGRFQRLVWEADEFPIIRREVEHMLSVLDRPIDTPSASFSESGS
jgi:hypothetical protein